MREKCFECGSDYVYGYQLGPGNERKPLCEGCFEDYQAPTVDFAYWED